MTITRAVLAASMLLAGAMPTGVGAGGSSPLLSIASADAAATAGGVRAIAVAGSFNFEDVLQGVFPAGLVVHQGTHFARFDQAGAVVDGSAALLADGLDATEVSALLAVGAPSPAPGALAQLRADRVSVVLPPGFAPGAATVVLYAVHEGAGYVSNSLTVTLP